MPAGATKLAILIDESGAVIFTTPSGGKRTLDFKIQKQWLSKWCWAASAASIANYYEKTNEWSPCKVANRVLGRDYCCGPRGAECDQGAQFYEALEKLGHLQAAPRSGISFSTVKNEIDAGRPVLVAMKDLGGHGVIITGYDDFNVQNPKIEVQDSAYETSKGDYDFVGFPGNYGAGYDWLGTCLTK